MSPLPVIALLSAVALGAAAPAAGAPVQDVSREVSRALAALPFYTVFDNLEFQVSGGEVTLSGEVTRPALKNDAGQAVAQIPGVARVVNRIEVLPDSASDAKLRLAEYLAIYGDPVFIQYERRPSPPIHIVVSRGAVTLVGTVVSADDSTEAFTQASAVPGVVSLTNRLQVEP